MNLTGFAGQATGVPYPVIARISFGVFGANLAALIRAVIAIAWYGIQTWLASQAVVVLAVAAWPGVADHHGPTFLGLDMLGWARSRSCGYRTPRDPARHGDRAPVPGLGGPRHLGGDVRARRVDRDRGRSDFSLNLTDDQKTGGAAVQAFLVATALTITYFSTLLLNFCDFSRFAPDRPTVVRGNFWGLPVNFMAFAVVTVAVTAGSIAVFGEAITDPVEIVARIDNTWVTVIGAITFVIATIGINVVANFVSACYDLANVAPKYIDFRRGGLISAIAAVVITPWHLYSSPDAIFYFLGGLGALLGPLFGVIFTDYDPVRRQRVTIEELYLDDPSSRYYYRRGWNPKALIAGGVAAVFSLFVAFYAPWKDWSAFSWFVGVVIAAVVYYLISARDFRQPELGVETPGCQHNSTRGGTGMTDLDLVIRAPRLISTTGEVGRIVGVKDGTIVAIEPLSSDLTAPQTVELATMKRCCRGWSTHTYTSTIPAAPSGRDSPARRRRRPQAG